jgi:DNA adenine methylase
VGIISAISACAVYIFADDRSPSSILRLLPQIQARLKNVIIENQDFRTIIKNRDRPNRLFYLDPPYYSAENYYEGFSKADHEILREILGNIKGKFILSYNDNVNIYELYKNFNIHEISRPKNLGGGVYKELIITNY